jgi:hypothetical protein
VTDIDFLLLKASNVRKHLNRLAANCDDELEAFLSNQDHQDIVCFNLQHSKLKCSIIAFSIPAMISVGNSPIRLTSRDRSNVLI